MSIITRYSETFYVYSVDECFLNFKQYEKLLCLESTGAQIRKAVWKEARLAVCVGMGRTLTLSKIANHVAKQDKERAGVCVLRTEIEEREALAQLTVDKVWGIGRKLSEKLRLLNVVTALDLAKFPPQLATQQFGIEVKRTIRELNGIECKKWDEVRKEKQNIYSTRTLGCRVNDIEALTQALAKHVAIAAKKIRAQSTSTRVMLIFASSSQHDENPRTLRKVIHFESPTSCTMQLTTAIAKEVHNLYKPGINYYKIGVGLLELTNDKHQQFDMFATNDAGNPALMNALDNSIVGLAQTRYL
ncbi:hypothetical protein TUM3792_43290 [Shewanella sp. MBTL60-007]|nr:hypothetical protein TUM3792_43290 [Shewanella sp. MBTL60-007]